jgi:uncharacterized iron-regulated membrane protein
MWTTLDTASLSIDPRTGRTPKPETDSNEGSRPGKLARWMLRLHRGDLLGLPGRWLGLVCGIAMLLLGVSGLTMYLKIYIRRIKLREWRPFW